MRINGLELLINRAVEGFEPEAIGGGGALLRRYRKAIVLGALREDVWYIPLWRGRGWVLEHLSISHFYTPPWPGGFIPFLSLGPRFWAERYLNRAARAHSAGQLAKAFVQLGRVAHLLADMACPVHVHRCVHDTDTFEWYVDAHAEELSQLAIPKPPINPPKGRSASGLIHSLATFTATFPADPTQFGLGRALKKRGWLRAVPRSKIPAQARAIIPVAIAHMMALFELYLERVLA